MVMKTMMKTIMKNCAESVQKVEIYEVRSVKMLIFLICHILVTFQIFSRTNNMDGYILHLDYTDPKLGRSPHSFSKRLKDTPRSSNSSLKFDRIK